MIVSVNKQIEALRLADAIQLGWLENVDPNKADIDMIQAELRRLHEVNTGLLGALQDIVNSAAANQAAINYPLIDAARAAIAKATGLGV